MTGISGGRVALVDGAARTDTHCDADAHAGVVAADRAGVASDFEPGSTESRVLDAVVMCAGRWGIDKTTVDDVAREAGVSRATVYRLFPGGKSSMVHLTTDREVVSMLLSLSQRVERCESLTDAVVELLHGGSTMVANQPPLAYMRAHEPGRLRAFFSFDRLDALFALTAEVIAPSLHRFLDPSAARECVVWSARLVVSYYVGPDPERDLADPAFARRVAETHVIPGIRTSHPIHPRSDTRTQETQT